MPFESERHADQNILHCINFDLYEALPCELLSSSCLQCLTNDTEIRGAVAFVEDRPPQPIVVRKL